MTMSSVMFIKKMLRKSSRASCLSREGQESTPVVIPTKPTHYSERQTTVALLKNEDEAFGFNLRTYEGNTIGSDLLTCVHSVKENSPAQTAGLRIGDVIVSVNSVHVEGFEHKQIVDLVQKGSCLLKMEIVRGSSVKRRELQKKLEHLEWQLGEKRAELQMIISQEERLRGGELLCTQPHSGFVSEQQMLSSSHLLQT